mmetsp:Transcript_23342/g.17768  ORF Transcript_23342/g.17768 Transcript_23342/m.17768 type:complete len:92 (+) Transcript_23342:263-538(+)
MRAAAASSDCLYLRREESSRAISLMYYAKKKICSSYWVIDEIFLYRSRNRSEEGNIKLNSSVLRILVSIYNTSVRVNLFSDIVSKSFSSGG